MLVYRTNLVHIEKWVVGNNTSILASLNGILRTICFHLMSSRLAGHPKGHTSNISEECMVPDVSGLKPLEPQT